ncbi:MAG: glycosyltransferase [Candidatus Omnitrophica bacterium]|nr:glycosyltransferase [Candidatus Omnitrophota bacterium]
MKILNVNMTLDPVSGGGTAERTSQISKFLAKKGAECSVLTIDPEPGPQRKITLEGVKIVSLPCLSRRFYIPKFSYRKIKSLVSDADIINITGHWTILNALVYCAARRLKKPYAVCPAGALPIYGRSRILKKLYNLLIGKKIICNATACVAIAENEKAHFKAYRVAADKITLIPNGINPDDFKTGNESEFRKKYNIGPHPFILFMGRLNQIKGPDLLLRSFLGAREQLKMYHLIFAGPDDGMRAELEDLCKRHSLSNRVHFTGYLGAADKTAAYRGAELLAIPSRQEAMSIVVLEAGISGKAVLITDQCGFNDVAAINGGVVVPASVEGIQVGLTQALRDPERLRLMGRNLKKHVEDNFTWDITVDKSLRLYDRILAGK